MNVTAPQHVAVTCKRRPPVIRKTCPIRTRRQLRRSTAEVAGCGASRVFGVRAEKRSFLMKTPARAGLDRWPLSRPAARKARRRAGVNDMIFPAPGLPPANGVRPGQMFGQGDTGPIALSAVRPNPSPANAGQEPLFQLKDRGRNARDLRCGFLSAVPGLRGGLRSPVSYHHPKAYSPDRQSEYGGRPLFPRPGRAAATLASQAKVRTANGEQDAHRRIAPGRDPGGGAPR